VPCNPNDVSINIPDGPSGPALPGVGIPFALKIPDIVPIPGGFPEDLLDILNKFQLLLPPGALKPQLNPNFGKDIFDAIMKLMDQFFPFLMLYKFFLPLLNIIVCIIEVLCSLLNPFKLIGALKRLFRKCIPEFLNLFPIFALIIMIISLLLLLLALIEYIIAQILKFIKMILRNILALNKAFQDADQNSILAIAKKLGSLLCIFQNLFVLLSIFNIIIGIIKDILSQLFSIPPCEDTDPGDEDGCCTPDVCPDIVKTDYTRTTGSLQYFKKYGFDTGTTIPGFGPLTYDLRAERWQFYDLQQLVAQKFINIVDAYDVTNVTPKPVFFPTDVSYDANTNPKQAAYILDLRFMYYPSVFGRAGTPRYVRLKNCIMQYAPSINFVDYNNDIVPNIYNGNINLVGGKGYEDDGTTVLTGFAADGVTPITDQATIENFIHMEPVFSVTPVFANDGVLINNVEYTFKPNIATLLNKNLVTAGCEPSFALNRAYINNVFTGDIGLKIGQLNGIFNNPNPNTGLNFPDPDSCQSCLQFALTNLRNNLTPAGVAEFEINATLCLQKLKDETNGALSSLIGVGFEPCNSSYVVEPPIQFTSKPILVSVYLKERNSIALTNTLPIEVSSELEKKISAHITFGEISNFTYDGYQAFTAELTSEVPGTGDIMLSFDDNIFCTNNLPEDINIDPSRTLQTTPYKFVYTPAATGKVPGTGEGDTDGKPARNETDIGNS
jgi:hypothetical protein